MARSHRRSPSQQSRKSSCKGDHLDFHSGLLATPQGEPSCPGLSYPRQKHQAPNEKKTHPSDHRDIPHWQMVAQNRQASHSSVRTVQEGIYCSTLTSAGIPSDPIYGSHPKCRVSGYDRHGNESPSHVLGGTAARPHEELTCPNEISHDPPRNVV